MKCRQCIKNDNGNSTIVWFGSQGINDDGTKIPADNYVSEQHGVACSLVQRLSVIKGELWYSINYGLPLLDKNCSKSMLDSFIISTATKHKDVDSIVSFTSMIDIRTKHYIFDMTVRTKYGLIDVTN